MTNTADAVSSSQYESRRYARSLLGRSWRLLREFKSVGLGFLLAAGVGIVARSLLRGPLLVGTIELLANGFAVTVACLAVARATGRSTESRGALLRGLLVGTPLAMVLLFFLAILPRLPLALPRLASELSVDSLLFAAVAFGGVTVSFYLFISLPLVIPATLVDRVGPLTGLRRGWAVAKTVRLPIVLLFATGLGVFWVARILSQVVVAAVGQSILGTTGVTLVGALSIQIPVLFLTLSLSFLYVDRVTDLEALG